MPADAPAMVVVCFVVGAPSLKAARRELLTWAAIVKGSERVLNAYLAAKEFNLPREASPVTELAPELMVRLDVDATTRMERIEYDA